MGRIIYFAGDFFPYLLVNILFFLLFVFSAIFLKKAGLKLRLFSTAIFFSVFVFFLLFTCFEFYFRYVYDQSDGLGFLKVNKKWQERHVVYNSSFLRDREFKTEKRSGEIRIAAVGDSLTFGAGIKNTSDRFTNILEKKLKDSGKDASVYNFGVSGIDTAGEVDIYKNKVGGFNPDIVILQYYLNDIQTDNSQAAEIFQENSKRGRLVTTLSDLSYFFDFLYWRLNSKYTKTFGELNSSYLSQYADSGMFDAHKELLAGLLNQISSDGKKVVVIIFPLLNAAGDNYPALSVHANLDEFFRLRNVEVIDLLPDLSGRKSEELVASKFDAHPNEMVHSLAAEKLYNSVIKLLEN